MGTAMGDLPYDAEVRVLDPTTHRRLWLHKLDIGGGGSSIAGVPREIDLYGPAAAYVANATCTWTGRILWRLRG